jgi:hypothetical protein
LILTGKGVCMKYKITITYTSGTQEYYNCKTYNINHNYIYLDEMEDKFLKKPAMLAINLNEIRTFYVIWMED